MATLSRFLLDPFSRDAGATSGRLAQRVPFLIAGLGADVDPYVVPLDAVPADGERRLTFEQTRAALAARQETGATGGHPRNARGSAA